MSGYADSISILDDYFPHLNSNSRHFLNISGSDIFTSNNSHHASSLNTSSGSIPLNSAPNTSSNNAPASSAVVSSSASTQPQSTSSPTPITVPTMSNPTPSTAASTSSPTPITVPTMSNPTPSTAASSSSQQSLDKGEVPSQQQQQPQPLQAQPQQQAPRSGSPSKMQLPLDNSGNSSGDENESRGTKRSGSFDDGDKKKRIKWAGELHERFLKAIEKLGDRAVPSAILNEMKVEGLTRENVASHLQKYRVQTREKLLSEYIKHAPPILYPPPLPGRVGHGLPYPHDLDYDLYHRRRSESELYYPQHYPHHRASMPALPAYGAHYYGAHPPAGHHYPTITEAAASYHSGGSHHYSTTPLAHYPRSASFSHSVECAYPDSVEGEHPSHYPQSSWRSGGAFTPINNPALVRRSSFSHATPSAGAPPTGAPTSRSSHPESDHLDEGTASSFHPQSSGAAPSSGKELFPDFPILSAGPAAGSRGGHAAPMADYGNGQTHPGNCSSGFCCGNTSEAPTM